MIAVPASAPKSAAEAAAFMEAQARTRQLTTAPGASGIATWFLCFVSFSGLQAIQAIGTLAAIVFIAPWALLLAWRIPALVAALARDRILLLFPLFALCTTAWSQYPAMSLRHGLEFLVTTIIGIAAARCVERRTIVTSLLFALAIPTILTVASVRHLGDFRSGGFAGVYGDKNVLASYSTALFIITAIFATSSGEKRLFRLFCAGLAIFGLLGLLLGHSAGSLVSLALVISWRFLATPLRRSGPLVPLFYVFGALALVLVTSFFGWGDAYTALLHSLGKDGTLTGRTSLWQVAFQQIARFPLAGCGYAAFWVVGNIPAEQLWAAFYIPNKMGFNFHDTYINICVENGIIYTISFFSLIVAIVLNVIKSYTSTLSAVDDTIKNIFLFFFVLSFVELEFGVEFSLQTVVLCIAWATSRSGLERGAAAGAEG